MGFIPEEVIQQVLDRCDIVEVVSSYVPLKKAGRNFKALSPFRHEKTPSFIVSPDKQIFHCFSSGMGGNVISFIMHMERLTFPEAVRLLADRCGVAIPQAVSGISKKDDRDDVLRQINEWAVEFYHRNLLMSREKNAVFAREYLKKRGISLENARKFQLGLALEDWDALARFLLEKKAKAELLEKAGLVIARQGKEGHYDRFRNRIMFPIFDVRGRCVAFGGRALDSGQDAKYINSPETPVYSKGAHLYGLQLSKQAIAQKDQVIVVEGYMDFTIPFSAGVDNIVASLGTALTQQQIRLIRRYTHNIVMLYDADPAGQAAMIRSLDLLIEEGMHARVAGLEQGEDPDSFVRKFGVEAFLKRVSEAKEADDFKMDFLFEKIDPSTSEGRSKIASEMLLTINRFQDENLKVEAIRKLAGRLSVIQSSMMTQQALITELSRIARQPDRQAGRVKAEEPADDQFKDVPAAERDLLRLMLVDADFIGPVQSEVTLDGFQHGGVKEVARCIFELFSQHGSFELTLLISRLERQEMINFVSGLVSSGSSVVGNKKKMYRDCVDKMKNDNMRLVRKSLLAAMEDAKARGDEQQLAKLAQEFNRLLKR